MVDKIYEDNISVSVGRFIIHTPQSSSKAVGRTIVLLHNILGNRFVARFNGLQDRDLVDLQKALSEYLRMLSLNSSEV